MKLIELTQGRVAIVDDEDFKWLSKWKWCYKRETHTGYAVRAVKREPHRQLLRMHIAILKRHKHWKHGIQIDHINTCGCDNRKENLRPATPSKQGANGRLQSNNTSEITGVDWHQNSWRVRIKIDGKRKYLGHFADKKDAITARRQAEIKYFREYCYDPTDLCPLWRTGQCPDCANEPKK